MTVSNVFNGKGKLAEATRERVMQAIEALGYRPDPMGLRLKGAAIARIGFIHFDVESMFISGAIAAITVAAAERGLQLLIRRSKAVSRQEALALAGELVRAGA
ncbi:DNA-binding LacI/PurR family transcriptional regulator [Novosphingobium sediminicola]|uniref:DNA-binding LacI/PurR family transcriptional regulator n=2 Tax=Novosphingobium sediminicola TaxID=563162 RepID=A0A7W6CFR6_9SPHN|nr:DNA-binding LacI/PurR family transcriptional regulator [Novosphingobium sediminicola]